MWYCSALFLWSFHHYSIPALNLSSSHVFQGFIKWTIFYPSSSAPEICCLSSFFLTLLFLFIPIFPFPSILSPPFRIDLAIWCMFATNLWLSTFTWICMRIFLSQKNCHSRYGKSCPYHCLPAILHLCTKTAFSIWCFCMFVLVTSCQRFILFIVLLKMQLCHVTMRIHYALMFLSFVDGNNVGQKR